MPYRIDHCLIQYLQRLEGTLAQIPIAHVERIVRLLLLAQRDGRHVYIFGNGGSAATASHFACDLSKATIVDGEARLRVLSLTDNVALLTAWANDTTYDSVFAEQVAALVQSGDVVVAISARGNSPNVLQAVRAAACRGAWTVGMSGFDGGALSRLVDISVVVPTDDYGVVEDVHLALEHAITSAVRVSLQNGWRQDLLGHPLGTPAGQQRLIAAVKG